MEVKVRPIYLPSKEDALFVVDRLEETQKEYGYVTVGDLYDSVGLPGATHRFNLIGWTDFEGLSITKTKKGEWKISFPPHKTLSFPKE